MLVHVVHSLLQLGSWEAIRGMGVWMKSLRGQTPPWMVAAEAQAKSKYGELGLGLTAGLDLMTCTHSNSNVHAVLFLPLFYLLLFVAIVTRVRVRST